MKMIRSYFVTLELVLFACLVLAVIWCVMAVPSPAIGKPSKGKPDGKKQEINLALIFRDDVDDRIQSDGLGPYFKDAKNKARAFIGLGGQLRLATGNNRSLHLDFTDAFDSECLPFFVGESGGLHTGKADENGDGKLTSDESLADLTLMTPHGSPLRIGLQIRFGFDGIGWVLQFGDQMGMTDLVTVVGGPDENLDGFSDSWVIEANPLVTDLPDTDPLDDLPAALLTRDFDANTNVLCNFVFMPFAVLVEKE